MKKNTTRGFTIFFAALVASLALAVGLAIYDLTVRQLTLASASRDSQYAIYAADSGIECALYWDNQYPAGTNGSNSAFASSTYSLVPGLNGVPGSGLSCNTRDIVAHGTMPSPYTGQDQTSDASWTALALGSGIIADPSSATTTFYLTYPPPDTRCVKVEIAKYRDSSGFDHTVITSHGYNTCLSGGAQPLERILQVLY